MKDKYDIQKYRDMIAEEIGRRNDEDYCVNEPQMERFTAVYNYFVGIIDSVGGDVNNIVAEPKLEHASASFRLPMLYIKGDDVIELADCVKDMSAIIFNPREGDMVDISFTVPNVFIHR